MEPRSKTEIYLVVDNVDSTNQTLRTKEPNFAAGPKDQPCGVRDATFVDPDEKVFIIESFKCKICGKNCQSYCELLEKT